MGPCHRRNVLRRAAYATGTVLARRAVAAFLVRIARAPGIHLREQTDVSPPVPDPIDRERRRERPLAGPGDASRGDTGSGPRTGNARTCPAPAAREGSGPRI